MNIFQKISLLGRINKAVKTLKELQETNSPVVDEIIAIINDLIKILDRIKAIIPSLAELVEEIKDLVKKIIGK